MPYPSQLDADAILNTARAMIEAGGVGSLSLNKLAKAFKVSTPSLYRYYDSKAALLRAVNADTVQRLFDALAPALDADAPPTEKALRVAMRYRAFAAAHPLAYGLVFTNTIDNLRPDEAENVRLVRPYQQLMAQISGEAASLVATRGYLALLHGFVMLELAQQLRRGGDLDAAFEQSMRAYLAGWHNRDFPSE